MHPDDLPDIGKQGVLMKIREQRAGILSDVEALPLHERSIGLSTSLMSVQLRQDIEHIESAVAAIDGEGSAN